MATHTNINYQLPKTKEWRFNKWKRRLFFPKSNFWITMTFISSLFILYLHCPLIYATSKDFCWADFSWLIFFFLPFLYCCLGGRIMLQWLDIIDSINFKFSSSNPPTEDNLQNFPPTTNKSPTFYLKLNSFTSNSFKFIFLFIINDDDGHQNRFMTEWWGLFNWMWWWNIWYGCT